jgi:hypothetical protein
MGFFYLTAARLAEIYSDELNHVRLKKVDVPPETINFELKKLLKTTYNSDQIKYRLISSH